jgi:ketosteroid isomerase-like protein
MDESTAATIATIEVFNAALNRHDLDVVMALMTEDCLFENTYPPPDGERFTGQAAVRGFWEGLLRASPSAHFETEELFASGDRCTTRWRYRYTNADGSTGYIRGADIFRVRDGKVAEKFSYVKG